MHLNDQKLGQPLDVEESDQIARTLIAFSNLLPEETPQPWPRYCGAMGMCFGFVSTPIPLYSPTDMSSSLLVLDESRRKHMQTSGVRLSSEYFNTALARMNYISERFNRKIHQVNIQAISPFPPHSLFLGVKAQDKLWIETGDVCYLEAANALVTMLGHYSKRWASSRMYWITPEVLFQRLTFLGKYLEIIEANRRGSLSNEIEAIRNLKKMKTQVISPDYIT
jgi:hypothetical protein